MAPYPLDRRTRVLHGWDAGMPAEAGAEKYHGGYRGSTARRASSSCT